MTTRVSPKKAARIAASLNDQRLDVKLGILSAEDWEKRAQDARDLGVTVPPLKASK